MSNLVFIHTRVSAGTRMYYETYKHMRARTRACGHVHKRERGSGGRETRRREGEIEKTEREKGCRERK